MSRSTIALERRVPAWLLAVLALAAPILVSEPQDFASRAARERLENIQPDICLLAEGNRYADQLKAFDLNYCFPWMKAVHRVCEQKEPVSHLRRTFDARWPNA